MMKPLKFFANLKLRRKKPPKVQTLLVVDGVGVEVTPIGPGKFHIQGGHIDTTIRGALAVIVEFPPGKVVTNDRS